MLTKLSKKMTSFFIRKNIVEEDQRDVYDYCFEILLSTLINLIAIVIGAVVFMRCLESLIFVVVFMMLRAVVGGFHANTHIGCFLSLMIFFGAMIGLLYADKMILFILGIIFQTLASVTILIFAPVDCENKRFTDVERRKLRVKVMIYIAIVDTAYVIMTLFKTTQIFSFCVSYSSMVVSLLVLFGKFKNMVKSKKS